MWHRSNLLEKTSVCGSTGDKYLLKVNISRIVWRAWALKKWKESCQCASHTYWSCRSRTSFSSEWTERMNFSLTRIHGLISINRNFVTMVISSWRIYISHAFVANWLLPQDQSLSFRVNEIFRWIPVNFATAFAIAASRCYDYHFQNKLDVSAFLKFIAPTSCENDMSLWV